MSVLLLILGILSVAAGAGMIALGIPINEFGLGNTLIVSGVTAITGGLLLVGLSAAVRQLQRISDALSARPAPRAVRPGEPVEPQLSAPRPAPRPPAPPVPPRRPGPPEAQAPEQRVEPRVAEPRPSEPRVGAPPVNVSSEAIDRLRSTFPRGERPEAAAAAPADDDAPPLPRVPAPKIPVAPVRPMPAGTASEPRVEPRVEVKAEPRPPAAAPASEAARGEAKGPGLNFPWRSKPRADQAPAPIEDAPAIAPNGDRHPAPPASAGPPSAPEPTPQPASDPATTPVAVLKSGVVDGMAYTLYADGSIEAKLPEGTVRFGSISELRAHLETHENQG